MHSKYLFLLMTIFLACSIKAPELTLTGEKTALENQILGTYEKVETDSWISASARTAESEADHIKTQQRQAVLLAVQNQNFNRDEIEELKQQAVIGENNKGFLDILENEKYQTDNNFKNYVDLLINEENRDRKTIYQQVFAINNKPDQTEESHITSIFAKLQFEKSKPGTMIQNPDGSWVKKQ